MNILVINSGSSSLKYEMFDMKHRDVLTNGLVERIGESHGMLHHQWRTSTGALEHLDKDVSVADHREALRAVGDALRDTGVFDKACQVSAIGHRVVHGGEAFQGPVLVDRPVVDALRELSRLAPLHNPANLLGIEVCLEAFPNVPQVAVFDTAFHQSIPPHAYHYALPLALYKDHQVRRYGFHGTSHSYVAKRTARYLERPLDELNMITLHLGNGASAAAIAKGRSIDTSMGMTPLEGLVMGTRCGDIDPALVFYIEQVTGKTAMEVEALLNRESGLKGMCGVNDMREILRRSESGDQRACLALEVYCYRIKKYIGAYIAVLGTLDALVFTAGIGENSATVRQRSCDGLTALGIEIDAARNKASNAEISELQADRSRVKVLVVHTDEEFEIAEQVRTVVSPTCPS